MLVFDQLVSITNGTALQFARNYPLVHLLTDSRKVSHAFGSVFFAVKGDWNNGHKYIHGLYHKGVRQFIVESLHDISGAGTPEDLAQVFPEANFILVKSSLTALQAIAAYHRSLYDIPVVGITGSNGKTIVKEWLSQLLAPDERIVKSPRSYNSQIGVPLSVWQMGAEHTFAVFEAGISRPGEMEKLEEIIRPTFGIFTNLGNAHDEGFESQQQKLTEKLKLFKRVGLLFYCRDYELLHQAVQASNIPAFTWSEAVEADVQILSKTSTGKRTSIAFTYQQQEHAVILPFSDDASVENCMHCLAFLLHYGLPVAEISYRLEKLQPVAMRLEMKAAINDCYIIDDTYNNDLAGLQIALDLLVHQPRQGGKTVILSDVLESGLNEEVLYGKVAAAISNHHIDKFIGIGKHLGEHLQLFAPEAKFYETTEAFLSDFDADSFQNETILIKGARVFGFERIVQAFQQKVHGTVLEVNLDALVHNLNYYRSMLEPGTKMMVMVKAFGYGSGSYEIANLLQFHRVDYLAVAYTDEGVALRENGISLPVMVMNPSPDSFATIHHHHLEPEIYSLELFKAYLHILEAQPPGRYPVHIKLDTGMHRLGFTANDLDELVQLLKDHPQVQVVSVFSHLAGADEALHNDFSQDQIRQFTRMAAFLEKELNYKFLRHILNSAGIIRFPDHHFDMVRLGIGLYGVEASGLAPEALQTVGTLKTTISQVKQVHKGETVGYSRKGIARSDKTIATLAIGYADGYDRRFGNGIGHVLIRGKKAPVIGNVCMDMVMVDVTGIEAQPGDEVIVFGSDLPIVELAAAIGTIPYELLTNVSTRVKRIFYSE